MSEPQRDDLDVLARDERLAGIPELTHPVSQVFDALDAIGTDSKLTSARLLLEDLLSDPDDTKRICIVVDFVSTLYYLAEDLESRAHRFVLFSSSMSFEERYTALERFRVEGNILLTTGAISQGANLQYVSDVILYDIPRNPLSLDQLIGRFDRFGRQLPLTIHAIYPMNRLDQHTNDGLALLRSRIARGPTQK